MKLYEVTVTVSEKHSYFISASNPDEAREKAADKVDADRPDMVVEGMTYRLLKENEEQIKWEH